jgi:Cysteine rich repeat
MKRLMVLMIALLIPPAATVKGPCHDDVQKFCKDVGKAKGAVVACLQQHMAELSEACKTQLSQQPS